MFVSSAYVERKRMRDTIATVRGHYTLIGQGDQDKEQELAVRAKINSALKPYGLKDLTFNDFSVLPLLVISSTERSQIQRAWLELALIGLGLLCQAAAGVVSLAL